MTTIARRLTPAERDELYRRTSIRRQRAERLCAVLYPDLAARRRAEAHRRACVAMSGAAASVASKREGPRSGNREPSVPTEVLGLTGGNGGRFTECE